ncbi:hypothetical protein D9613_008200 [Agrocybe pediades]|uniref:Nephrocystin 3-like N-terminal domain-containing protein n=1 Tax=Agrocybe pediades TaxID=84607 RepID=A0A8H4VLC0_9AGAR|nr:hypothetical protein D9613_008200 [Agrocybe pediades]
MKLRTRGGANRRLTMISSKQVLVTGGQFSQYNNYHGQASLDNKAAIDILTDAVAPSAFHDSEARFDPPKCHPRTRVKVLEKIMDWIVGAAKPFLWLNGAAGAGKSAIAQSTIEEGIERGLLHASFFFSRSDPSRNHAGPLIATLAYQLYCAFPESEVQTTILSAIKKDPLIFKKTLQRQFTSLVSQPLNAYFSRDESTQHRMPFVIVIDGLDECIDRASQKATLTGLASSVQTLDPYIRILIASRPEHDIKLSFSSKHMKDIHSHLSLDLDDEKEADADIKLYLHERFAQIKDEFDNRTTGRKLDTSWPGEEVIEELVDKSSGQFIYAATVVRYVESTRHRPDRRLDIVLNLRPHNGDNPFAQLDALYAMILESASDIDKVLHVLSLHMMESDRNSICCTIIEKLLLFDEGELETLFCDLGALVQIRWAQERFDLEPHQYLRILHASLFDYLLDKERSNQFSIDRNKEDTKHTTHILQYLATHCSTSFNSHLEMPLLYTFFFNTFTSCWGTISLELQQAAFSFPLRQFLTPHSDELCLYTDLVQFFVSPFLGLLEIMTLKDPQCSYIKDHQQAILISVINRELERYYNDDMLACLLLTFNHIGSHRFVPIVKQYSYVNYMIILDVIPFADTVEADRLFLRCIWNASEQIRHSSGVLHCRHTFYHDFVHRLLCDPSHLALGPRTYEEAALFCFKHLGAIPLPVASLAQDVATDDAEDDTCANAEPAFLDTNGGEWTLSTEHFSILAFDNDATYFFLLGYTIVFLPYCGRSETLILACEEYKASIAEKADGWAFPIRRRLLLKEIDKYLFSR